MLPCATFKKSVFFLAVLLVFTSCGIKKSLEDRPNLENYSSEIPQRKKLNDSTFVAGNNFLTKNKYGLWELYVEGDPLQIGLLTGSLTEELLQHQEAVFFEKISTLVPSEGRQKFLRKFLAWYNRKMHLHIPAAYKAEIWGVSRYASTTHNDIAVPYLRSLYLHGAHDIGHALQDLMLVGCSSFAAWGKKTKDGSLLIARNFDFYAGDEFAENKIIAFVNPSHGRQFMSVTWGGMIGVVSGMNDAGLTVTINAGKSKIPFVAKAPISLVAREILQYATTIEEAIAIAKGKEVFVSEAIFVGSANDGKAAIIEVSPNNFGVYQVENGNTLICSNHFQSAAFSKDKRNLKHIEESHSAYRFERMEQLISEEEKLNPTEAVAILRNKKGLDDKSLGYGNEKALNQLLAHHGIVFQPEERKVWVSANPYQLGEFVAYDLDDVFDASKRKTGKPLAVEAKTIAKDSFLQTQAYRDYEAYRKLEGEVEQRISNEEIIESEMLQQLKKLNPNYWKANYLVGTYYYEKGYDAAALREFKMALTKEITTLPDSLKIERLIKKLER